MKHFTMLIDRFKNKSLYYQDTDSLRIVKKIGLHQLKHVI